MNRQNNSGKDLNVPATYATKRMRPNYRTPQEIEQ